MQFLTSASLLTLLILTLTPLSYTESKQISSLEPKQDDAMLQLSLLEGDVAHNCKNCKKHHKSDEDHENHHHHNDENDSYEPEPQTPPTRPPLPTQPGQPQPGQPQAGQPQPAEGQPKATQPAQQEPNPEQSPEVEKDEMEDRSSMGKIRKLGFYETNNLNADEYVENLNEHHKHHSDDDNEDQRFDNERYVSNHADHTPHKHNVARWLVPLLGTLLGVCLLASIGYGIKKMWDRRQYERIRNVSQYPQSERVTAWLLHYEDWGNKLICDGVIGKANLLMVVGK